MLVHKMRHASRLRLRPESTRHPGWAPKPHTCCAVLRVRQQAAWGGWVTTQPCATRPDPIIHPACTPDRPTILPREQEPGRARSQPHTTAHTSQARSKGRPARYIRTRPPRSNLWTDATTGWGNTRRQQRSSTNQSSKQTRHTQDGTPTSGACRVTLCRKQMMQAVRAKPVPPNPPFTQGPYGLCLQRMS